MRIHLSTIAFLASCASSPVLSEDVQVTLKSVNSAYSRGEPIHLSYELLWLGDSDGSVFENSLAFPELEISYLNRFPVEMVELDSFEARAVPSRHERRTFAPTMRFESRAFQINSLDGIRFLDGRLGYYRLEKTGMYVIRAVFRESSVWKLYDGQQQDIASNAVVIEIRP